MPISKPPEACPRKTGRAPGTPRGVTGPARFGPLPSHPAPRKAPDSLPTQPDESHPPHSGALVSVLVQTGTHALKPGNGSIGLHEGDGQGYWSDTSRTDYLVPGPADRGTACQPVVADVRGQSAPGVAPSGVAAISAVSGIHPLLLGETQGSRLPETNPRGASGSPCRRTASEAAQRSARASWRHPALIARSGIESRQKADRDCSGPCPAGGNAA